MEQTEMIDRIEREHMAAIVGVSDSGELTTLESAEMLARCSARAITVAKTAMREREGALNAATSAIRERDELREQVESLQQRVGRSFVARLLLPANAA